MGADGKLVEPEPDKYATKDLAESILNGISLSNGYQDAFQDIFYLAAVLPSFKNGLIPKENLTVSGDGTAVPVHANPFGRKPKHPKNPEESIRGMRHFSDPDAQWGWDSHEKNWYYGRTLYMLCCRNSDLKTELPILMNFTGAKRHDSINFLYAIDAFGSHGFGIAPTNLCLDSAHDNLPTYRLLERWDINALIDLNKRRGTMEGIPEDISLDRWASPLPGRLPDVQLGLRQKQGS